MTRRPGRFVTLVASMLAVGLFAAVALRAQTPVASLSILGKWRLVPAKSTVAGTTLTVTESADGQMTMTTGGETFGFRVDGKDHPGPFNLVGAWRKVGTRAWEATWKIGDQVSSVDRFSVSADDRTLTLHTESKGPVRGTTQVVFGRVSGGPGFAGVWRGSALDANTTAEYSVQGDRLRIHLVPPDQVILAGLDGKDYSIDSTSALPTGFTMSLKGVGPRTLTAVVKQGGTVVQTSTLNVSADGNTLEVAQVNGAPSSKQDRATLVYDRTR